MRPVGALAKSMVRVTEPSVGGHSPVPTAAPPGVPDPLSSPLPHAAIDTRSRAPTTTDTTRDARIRGPAGTSGDATRPQHDPDRAARRSLGSRSRQVHASLHRAADQVPWAGRDGGRVVRWPPSVATECGPLGTFAPIGDKMGGWQR